MKISGLKTMVLAICLLLLLAGCGSLAKFKARAAIDAINNGDMEVYLKEFSDKAIFSYPGNTSTSGEVEGKEAIRAWFENWRQVFPDIKLTIKEIYLKNNIYFGATNVIALHLEASGFNKFGERLDSSGICVVTIKGTKIVSVKEFIFDAHNLKYFWGE